METNFDRAPYRHSDIRSSLACELRRALDLFPYLALTGEEAAYVENGLRTALYGLGYGVPDRSQK